MKWWHWILWAVDFLGLLAAYSADQNVGKCWLFVNAVFVAYSIAGRHNAVKLLIAERELEMRKVELEEARKQRRKAVKE